MEINGSADQNAFVDSDHHHHITRNSTAKPMQSNGSRSNSPSHCGINRKRHSSVIPALPKTNQNSIVPSPNYLRASTGSCHDFCKFGRKKSFEESRPWRVVRKQSNSSSVVASTPNVENVLQNQADPLIKDVLPGKVDPLINDVLPGKVDEDDVPEKEKSCEKIEAEKKTKLLLNRKQQPTVVAKPKPVVAVISGEMAASIKKDSKIMTSKPSISKPVVNKNTERVEKKAVLDQPADIVKTSNGKPIIKIGKSLDVSIKKKKSSSPAAATSKREKPSSPAAATSKREKPSSPAAATSKKEKPSSPAAATSKKEKLSSLAAANSKKEKPSSRAAATSKKEKPSSLSPAASQPIKTASTNRLVKTNKSRQQPPIIKRQKVGICEESNNENSLKRTVIKQTVDADIIPAVESKENGDRSREESNNENSQEQTVIKQIVDSDNIPAVESKENGDRNHEESNNENSLEKTVTKQIVGIDNIPAVELTENGDRIHEEESSDEMEIVVESENVSVESNENGDNMEVEEWSEDDDDEEEEEETEYDDEEEETEEDSISESSGEEEEEEAAEEVEEAGLSRRNRAKKLTEDNNGSECVMLKFRRGRVIDIQSEEIGSPKRLRFRRRGVESPKEGRSHMKRHNFRKKATILPNNNNDNPDSEIIKLRHQDIEEKKDAQGLLNNVIEETANKLVEVRKSKVKALVGAFETVISLQENNNSNNSKQSSLQTVFS